MFKTYSIKVLLFFLLLFLFSNSPTFAATLPTNFAETRVTTGINRPTTMEEAPDGRIFVLEQGGKVRIIKNGTLLPTPFLTLSVNTAGERGLLGIAFDPNFTINKYVYIQYTVLSPAHNRISRFTVSSNPDVADPSSEVVLYEHDLLSASQHNGGAIHFGPDGKLYFGHGENKQSTKAQLLDSTFGKLLRINSDGTIPADNPYFSQTTGKYKAIWAIGLRNPYSFAFQPGTNKLFINDVGETHWEEIDEGTVGANYGWPTTEGATTNPSFKSPFYTYPHSGGTTFGCAIVGSAFYNPPAEIFPSDYKGDYFFGDYCQGWIKRIDLNSKVITNFASGIQALVDILVTKDGNLYYLLRGNGGSADGQVYKVTYTGNRAPTISINPTDVTVSEHTPATFRCDASGSTPITFKWQKNNVDIPNSNATSYTLSDPTSADNNALFRCIASNSSGSATSNSAKLTVLVGHAPTPVIQTPTNGTTYKGGDTINFSGTGTDQEDGTLPASAFSWRVDFQHADHVHPFMPDTSGITSGNFTIPVDNETDDNVWYRIYLTVTDSDGLSTTIFRDILPVKSTITIETNPNNLPVTVDGIPTSTPTTITGVVGIQRSIGATTQTKGCTTYDFSSWSDGGASNHSFLFPATPTTFTANFIESTSNTMNGLCGSYFPNTTFSGTPLFRADPTIDFTWAYSPLQGIPDDKFSVRWEGFLRPTQAGSYTFYTTSNDGVKLWINNQLVIDDYVAHWDKESKSSVLNLAANTKYPIKIEFFDSASKAVMKLSWSTSSIAKQIIPSANLLIQ